MSSPPAARVRTASQITGLLRRERWQIVVVGLGAAVVAAVMLPWLPGRDQGIEAATALAILRGAVPYRDVWNHNLPGGFLSLAMAFALVGKSPVTIRFLDVLSLAIAAGATASLGQRVAPRLGWLLAPTVLVLSYVGHGDPWNTAQRDGYLLPLGAAALALVVSSQRPRTALAAGVLVGVAALFKPGGLIIIAPILALTRGRARLLTVAGAAAPALLLAFYLAGTGATGSFLECVVSFNRTYARHFEAFQGRQDASLWKMFGHFVLGRPELWLAIPGAIQLRRSSLRTPLLLYLAAGLASAMFQAGLYPYHLLPLLAPIAVLSAGVMRALPSAGRVRTWLIWAAVAGLLAPSGYRWTGHAWQAVRVATGATTPAQRRSALRTPDFRYADIAQLSLILRERTEPGEPVLVWGIDPLVHFLSQRAPVTRFPTDLPLRTDGIADSVRPEFLRQLSGRWPRFVAIQKADVVPWMTGNNSDSLAAAGSFPELREVLERDYAMTVSLPTWLLLQRKDTIRLPPVPTP